MSTFSERGYYGAWDFQNGLARIGDPGTGNVYGYMDTAGNVVIELPEDIRRQHLKAVFDFYEGYAIIERSGRSFVIDETGNIAFSLEGTGIDFAANESGIIRFREGLAPIKADASGKYGFIDTNGNVVIPFIFDFQQRGFRCGLSATIRSIAQTGYVDSAGNVVLSLSIPRDGGIAYGDFYEDSAIVFISKSNGTTTTCLLEIVRK